jgi:hypothetical protein
MPIATAFPGAITAVALATVSLLAWPAVTHAELKVRMPTVEYQEMELEHNGLVIFGPRGASFDRGQSYTNEIAYGITPWWQIELESSLVAGAGQSLRSDALAFENTFQLTEPGKYFVNLGFFAGYEHVTARGAPNAVTLGPIIQKELPSFLGLNTLHTANLFFTREVGPNAGGATGFTYAWQSVVRLRPLLAPGIEFYGQIESLGQAGRYNQQQHLVGPVLTGEQPLGGLGELKYEVGYLFGLTANSPTGAVRWRLEYEIAF